jgi:hypothetical protein
MPFAPIQTSPTMVWTKYPDFRIPPEVPVAINRPSSSPVASNLSQTCGVTSPDTSFSSAIAPLFTPMALIQAGARAIAGYYIGKVTGASRGWTAVGAATFGTLGVLGSVYFTRPTKMRTNSRPVRSAKTWDILWENYIAARRSGNKKRILDTAELLEVFDRSSGWEPTVTVRKVKKEFGWE